MKIGIDISSVIYGTGVSVYTENLVRSLLKIDRQNEYVFFGGSLRRQGEIHNFLKTLPKGRFKGIVIPLAPTAADFLWNRIHVLPVERLIGKIDVFHSSDWTQPPTSAAKVTTIHDLSFLRWPQTVESKVLAVQKNRLGWVMKDGALVIAVSESTKEEVVELLGIPEDRITVIPEAVPEDVNEFIRSGSKLNLLEKLKDNFGIKKPYIFAYGSQAPRKNIERLIEAFDTVKKKINCQLVIVGEYTLKERINPDIILTGHVSRSQILTLLAGSKLLAYPSLYEGFGLVVLEAFALGVPVVTSNVSSLPEVAGEAAIQVSPLKVNEIARAIERVFIDSALRKKLIERGLARDKNFSWEKTAKKTLEVYEKVAKS